MKRIFLMRHGKSDWSADYQGDHERPLKRRGVRAAGAMGRFLARTEQIPDVVVSSSAVRALTTARLAAEAGNWPCEVCVEPNLYGATAHDALDEIHGLDNTAESVLLAGHEPTCSQLAGSLIGRAELRFPTAAVARIDVAVDRWEHVRFGNGALIWFAPPRLIRAGE